MDLKLDGRTGQGDVTNSFGGTIQTKSEGRTSTISGRVGEGLKIKAVTMTRGSITVRKN